MASMELTQILPPLMFSFGNLRFPISAAIISRDAYNGRKDFLNFSVFFLTVFAFFARKNSFSRTPMAPLPKCALADHSKGMPL
jgi:hypothetical protein